MGRRSSIKSLGLSTAGKRFIGVSPLLRSKRAHGNSVRTERKAQLGIMGVFESSIKPLPLDRWGVIQRLLLCFPRETLYLIIQTSLNCKLTLPIRERG